MQVLEFALLGEVALVGGLEADEEAAQAAGNGLFEQARLQPGFEDRVDGAGRLPDAAHAAHALEKRRGKAAVAEQMVVEEVEVAAGEAVDLGQGVVHALRIEGAAALEERLLVAEVADVRTAAGDHDRVGHQVQMAPDQVAANGRHAGEGADARVVPRLGAAGAQVGQEARPGVLAGPGENRVGVSGGLLGQRSDMQAPERDEDAAPAVRVGDLVGAARAGDVDLDRHQVGRVSGRERLNVLVGDFRFVLRRQIGGERGQAERRKERVLDRAEERAGGLGERRKDEFHAHAGCSMKYFA